MIYKNVYKSAGCFLLDKLAVDAKLLLIVSQLDDKVGYVLPKGTIESGEEIETAAIRETIEETGYDDFKIIQPLPICEFDFIDPHDQSTSLKTIYWYLALLNSNHMLKPNLTNNEQQSFLGYKWVVLTDAANMLEYDDERLILLDIINQM
jgi:8-oxo-dGTP pyrophosphatase MutT (NUDIX family)